MDTIDGMRTFVAVAGHHSFTEGAKRLGMSTKLASKYVRQLEERLQAQLFNRTTRTVTLTETGQAYLERCMPILDQLDELEGLVQARQSELAGVIRMTAPTGFGGYQLIDALHPFQLKHPKVSIDLHLSDQQIALVEQGFDLAVRFGQLNDSSLIARRLSSMRISTVASPDYLDRYGIPRHPEALATHNCLLAKFAQDPLNWRFQVDGEPISVRVSGTFTANAPRALARMAVCGLGIAQTPLYAVESYLERGQLKLLFEEQEPVGIGLYAVYPPSRHLTARIRALIDHLADVCR